MRVLTRYVLFEIVKVFLITLTAMTLFMILVSVTKEAYSQGLGLKQILLLLPFVLPEALRFSVPGTILFATCSVYGRMASTNEVVAIKAMGISPLVILMPTFVFAFVLSLVCVVLNDVACSWGRDGARRVVIESVEEIVYSKLALQRHYDSKQFGINVWRVDGKRLIRPTFTFSSSDDSPSVTITCEEAELRSDLKAATLTIVGLNGTIDVGGVGGFIPGTFERVMPLDEASRRTTKGASDLAMSQVPGEIKASQDRIAQIQQKMALLASEQLTTGDFSGLAGGQWAADERRLDEERVRFYRLLIEPSRRWANGFSCLCFVLLGAPAGIILRNSDFLTSFFACFMPILLIYYPLLFLGVDQAKLGILPAWSVWIGNAILAVCGAWLMRRVQRY
ncbi:MAG TPA: LptF/LptG family permease [Pirellulales bacterium]|jgi:lipopolysaccharide export system permease protein|nr:LptF/LptG family permease [Pirellulales bacterium]